MNRTLTFTGIVLATLMTGCTAVESPAEPASAAIDQGEANMAIHHSGLVLPADAGAGIVEQADSVFAQILAGFAAKGVEPGHVVRTRLYIKDMADFKAIAQAHARAFGDSGPANTMVVIAEFPAPGMRIMAEADAASGVELQPLKSGSPAEAFFGFSTAMRAGDHGYITGATGWNAEGKIEDPNDYYGQARIALGKIKDIVQQLGGDAGNVVMTRLYIRSFDGFEDVAKAHREVFGELRPASSLIEVKGFYDPGMALEIEAELHFGERRAIGSDSKYEPWFGFSRSYVTGDSLLISGSTGTGDDVAAQTESIIGHIDAALARAGHAPGNVVALRVFIQDMAQAEAVRGMLEEHYTGEPAFSFIIVPRLATDEMRVEVEAGSRRQE